MKEQRINEVIKKELQNEARRIMQHLLQMYHNGNKSDLPFHEIVLSMTSNKYKLYNYRILNLVIKEIPLDLYISPNGKKIFVTESEFYLILEEESNINIDNFVNVDAKKIADYLFELYNNNEYINIDILDILYLILKKDYEFYSEEKQINKLLNKIKIYMKQKGIDLLSYFPINFTLLNSSN